MATTECTAITRLIEDVQRQAIVEEAVGHASVQAAPVIAQGIRPMGQERPAWRPQGAAPAGVKRTLPPLPRNRAPSHTQPAILLEGSATSPVALEPIESLVETVSLDSTAVTAMPIDDQDVFAVDEDAIESDILDAAGEEGVEAADDLVEAADDLVEASDDMIEVEEFDDVEVQPAVAGSVVAAAPIEAPQSEEGPSVRVAEVPSLADHHPMFAVPRAAAPVVTPAVAAVAIRPSAFAAASTPTKVVAKPANKKLLAYGVGGVALFGAALGITSLVMKGGSGSAAPAAVTPVAAPADQALLAKGAGDESLHPAAVAPAALDPDTAAALAAVDTAPSTFDSDPAGATVTLIEAGVPRVLGAAPATAILSAGSSYEVMFALPGHATKLQTITVNDSGTIELGVKLSPIGGEPEPQVATPVVAESPRAPAPKVEPVAAREVARPSEKPAAKTVTARADKPAAKSSSSADKSLSRKAVASSASAGTLLLGSKPPCDIYIDGKKTGMVTPQREIKLSAGKHTIKLVNAEHGIKTSFSVAIKSGEKTKVIKDMSSKL